jgi:ribonuclease BN (tRNA processing enzyme)
MTGREAGESARDAAVGRLVVTHVPPWHDPEVARAEASEVFDGPIDLATPGMTIEVGR